MDPLAAELSGVLQQAMQAQELEDSNDLAAAIDLYYKLRSQLSFLLDMQLGGQATQDSTSALASLCQGLTDSYEHRIRVLRDRQLQQAAGMSAPWLQLEAEGAVQEHAVEGSALSAAADSMADRPSRLQQHYAVAAAAEGSMVSIPLQHHRNHHSLHNPDHPHQQQHQHQQQALQGAAGMAAGPQGHAELLRRFQRSVSGSLEDVIGMEDMKEEIEEAVFLPMKHPQLFQGLRKPPHTFLLHGPPGTGKTMVVEKVAAEAGMALLALSPSTVLSKWSGESEKALKDLFDLAAGMQPVIVFIDEVDSLGQARGDRDDASARRLLMELLLQLSRVQAEQGLYVFAATNRITDCDAALLRRFERRIRVPLPDAASRAAFLQHTLSQPELSGSGITPEQMQQLVDMSAGYSGCDLAAVCRQAAMAPIRALFRQASGSSRGFKRRRGCMGAAAVAVPEMLDGSHGPAATAASTNSSAADAGFGFTLQAQEQLLPHGDSDAGPAARAAAAAGDVQAEAQLQALPQLRRIVLEDFISALQTIKPAMQDAGLS